MLNWWLGRPPQGTCPDDEDLENEPPETPAPVFAARALKSALFGTPTRVEDDSRIDIKVLMETSTSAEAMSAKPNLSSPTKPAGILLTPGTATTRRKTVSFGTEVVENQLSLAGSDVETTGISRDEAGNRVSRWASKSEKSSRKTRLIRNLEAAREGKRRNGPSKSSGSPVLRPLIDLDMLSVIPGSDNVRSDSTRGSKSQLINQDLMEELVEREDFDGDMTVDLNEPHSQSGKYWKSEYDQYHKDAKIEMAKLLKYKGLARSYAKMKDLEAIALAEKLNEEQRRVAAMEARISMLSAKMAATRVSGDDEEGSELIKELARQTALTLQYKEQVEEFQATLAENDGLKCVPRGHEKRFASPRTEQTLLDTHRELKKAREQLEEMASLRDEIHKLRQTLSTADTTVLKLREENGQLTQKLHQADLRLEMHLEKCEKRKQASEEQRQKRDKVLQSLQQDYDTLKGQAKSQRLEAELLLRKRHDQVVAFKRELSSLKAMESTVRELQDALHKKGTEDGQVAAAYHVHAAPLKEYGGQELTKTVDPPIKHPQELKKHNIQQFDPVPKILPVNQNFHVRNSTIPVSSHSASRSSMVLTTSRDTYSVTPNGSQAPQSSQSALSEIINKSSASRLPIQRSGHIESTPPSNRVSSTSLGSAKVEYRTPELSPTYVACQSVHEKMARAGQRPSMFNIATDPGDAALILSQTLNRHSGSNSNGDLAGQRHINPGSSRLSSLEGSKARNFLPPERAAAAKVRLEQKNAAKRKAQAMGTEKENIRS